MFTKCVCNVCFSANLGNLFHDGTMWEEQKGDADSYIAHIGLQKKVDMTLSTNFLVHKFAPKSTHQHQRSIILKEFITNFNWLITLSLLFQVFSLNIESKLKDQFDRHVSWPRNHQAPVCIRLLFVFCILVLLLAFWRKCVSRWEWKYCKSIKQYIIVYILLDELFCMK